MTQTLGDLRTLQDYILADTSLGNYTNTQRIKALNLALDEVHRFGNGKFSFLIVPSTDISFTLGVADKPDNYYDAIILYEEDSTDSSISQTYSYKSPLDFLDNISNTWTIQDVSGTQKLKIYAADTVTLKLMYHKKPRTAEMSASSDTTGFPADYDKLIAQLSVAILINWKSRTSEEPFLIKYGRGDQTKPESGSVYAELSMLYQQDKKAGGKYASHKIIEQPLNFFD